MAKSNAVKTFVANVANATKAKETFATDKSKVMTAFTQTTLYDFEAIGAIVNKYFGKAEFDEMRNACRELAIAFSLTKQGVKNDAALCLEIATYDKAKNPEARDLTDEEKVARKYAANQWFGFTKKCNIKTQEARGGAGRGQGAKASDTSTLVAKVIAENTAAIQAAPPVTIKSITAERLTALENVAEHYTDLKHHLVKFQRANTTLFQGDEGARLRDIHSRLLVILAEV
jgi:hypothetical protein